MSAFQATIRADSLPVTPGAVSNASLSTNADLVRSKMKQEPLTAYPVALTGFRIWDAPQTLLPNPSATDDLGLYGGTFGTDSPTIQTFDLKTAGASTLRARIQLKLPPEYEAGETVTLRVSAGMLTTIADVSATIDVEAHEIDRIGAVGSDLVTTAALDINNLVLANKDFVITPTTLAPGDMLDIRITMAINDASEVTAVIGLIGAVELLCDIRG